MASIIYNRKRATYFALFLFIYTITSCGRPSHSWEREEITSSHPGCCTILYLTPQNSYRNIEIELQRGLSEAQVYLTVYGDPLSPKQDGTIDVHLVINHNPEVYSGNVLKGNYRIVLPPEAKNKLLNALEQHAEIQISVGRYSTEIHYEGFDTEYKEFCKSL